ncbi:caffeine-induced death protein 2-domain-containing protein [Fusarium oxysporum]|nr:caffeine-induced death protein 2-domain-containing protein [Fusarium oxysporum]
MTQPSTQPQLTPQFCFSYGTLRDFLRLSRSSIDDSITQNLNALIDPQSCLDFKEKVLFPSWETRTEVLNYCALVAASPDPDDPDRTIRELEKEQDRDRTVDERLDPYSGRFFPREARTERLASLVRQERGVEGIVRHRTWEVVQQRCGGDPFESWEDTIIKWRKAQNLKTNV